MSEPPLTAAMVQGIFWLRAACRAWEKRAWAAASWAGSVIMAGMGFPLFGVGWKGSLKMGFQARRSDTCIRLSLLKQRGFSLVGNVGFENPTYAC